MQEYIKKLTDQIAELTAEVITKTEEAQKLKEARDLWYNQCQKLEQRIQEQKDARLSAH